MHTPTRLSVLALVLALAALVLLTPAPTAAASKAEIDRDVKIALQQLYKTTPAAKVLAEKAKGILVFPSILKAGLIVGGQGGNGALLKKGKTVGYYNSAAASYGLQAGVQTFGYAMFFMTDAALAYLDKSGGWEIGVGPSIVIVDKETAAAFGKTATSSTLQSDIYAFIFSQKGLMAGLGIQGSKITRIEPK
ncbi:MAG: twin-arginine translocation pathway signal protein [Desulfuromonadales bacterium]|nr:MAG: twin-arginine translocation pathway signal protein [Desulfuromonadales bacterium]